ncbi:MAG: tetratricopeptide repeat protein, partial [Bacteroidota bacterium]
MKIITPLILLFFPVLLFAQMERDTLQAISFFEEGKKWYEERAFEKSRTPLSSAQRIYQQYELWELFHKATILLHDSYLKKRQTEYVKTSIENKLANWEVPDDKPNFYKGRYYYQLGVAAMYENASDQLLQYAKQALALFEKSVDKSYLGDAYTLIGNYYWQTGDIEKAVQFREQSVRTGIELYGESAPETIKNYSYLAMFLSRTNDLDKGIAYAKKAEQIAYKVDPEKYLIHPYEAFAGLYYYKGNYEKSLDYFRKNLAIQIKSYGAVHSEVAEQSRGIAACLDMLGKYEEAVPYYQKNIDIHEVLFGKFHRNITASQRGIAYNYFKVGQYKKAAEYIQTALFTSLQLETPNDILSNP